MYHQAWQVERGLTPRSPGVLGPHESAITGSKQELRIHQRTEEGIARSAIQTPKPLRLRRRQTKAGHLDVLALNTSKNVVEREVRCGHAMLPQVSLWVGGRPMLSNAYAMVLCS